jgi:hypothetical protein
MSYDQGPVRNFLRNLGFFGGGGRFGFQIELPEGVTEDQAVQTIARTPWAQDTAKGYARVMGLKPGTKVYDDAVNKWATHLARRAVTGERSTTGRRRRRSG